MKKKEGEKKKPDPALSINDELIEAAKEGNIRGIRAALERGAKASYDRNIPGTWGAHERSSPINHALAIPDPSSRLEACKILLEAGANPNAVRSSSDWRGCGSSTTAFQTVLKSVLGGAVKGKGHQKPGGKKDVDRSILSLFLRHGADANTVEKREAHTMRYDGSSSTPILHRAISAGSIEVAKLLLKAGANPDALAKNHGQSEYGPREGTEETALHVACTAGNVEAATVLLDAGASVNSLRHRVEQVPIDRPQGAPGQHDDPRSDDYEPTERNVDITEMALHIALRLKSEPLVKLLIARGADPEIPFVGDKTIPCAEIAGSGGSSLAESLEVTWTPQVHRLLHPSLRRSIVTLQLCSRRLSWPLPQLVMHELFAHVVRQWVEEVRSASRAARKAEEEAKKAKSKSRALFDEDDDL